MRNHRHFFPAILWGVVILLVISYPGENIPDSDLLDIQHIDKVVHFGLFAALGALLVYGFRKEHRGGRIRNKRLMQCIAFGIIYGILTEYLQHCCLSDRHGNVPDALANGFGTIFGVVISAQLFRKILDFQEKNQPD